MRRSGVRQNSVVCCGRRRRAGRRAQAGKVGQGFVEGGGFRAGRHAGAVLPHVHVEQYVHALPRSGQSLRQGLGGGRVIGGHGEATGRVGAA